MGMSYVNGNGGRGPALWAEGWQKLVWVRKRYQDESKTVNDAATDLVVDIRHFVTHARRVGWVNFETEI